jgi:hypothetical protein
MAVFWVVAPCSLVEALMMEATRASKTSVSFYGLHGAITQKTAIFILAAVRI